MQGETEAHIRHIGRGADIAYPENVPLPVTSDLLTSFRLHLERHYRYDDAERSLLSAICNDDMLQADARATLVDRIGARTEFAATLLRPCTA